MAWEMCAGLGYPYTGSDIIIKRKKKHVGTYVFDQSQLYNVHTDSGVSILLSFLPGYHDHNQYVLVSFLYSKSLSFCSYIVFMYDSYFSG